MSSNFDRLIDEIAQEQSGKMSDFLTDQSKVACGNGDGSPKIDQSGRMALTGAQKAELREFFTSDTWKAVEKIMNMQGWRLLLACSCVDKDRVEIAQGMARGYSSCFTKLKELAKDEQEEEEEQSP